MSVNSQEICDQIVDEASKVLSMLEPPSVQILGSVLGSLYMWEYDIIQFDFDQTLTWGDSFAKTASDQEFSVERSTAVTLTLIHEFCHSFQSEMLSLKERPAFQILFECQADIIAGYFTRNKIVTLTEVSDTVLGQIFNVVPEGNGMLYPPICIRNFALTALVDPVDDYFDKVNEIDFRIKDRITFFNMTLRLAAELVLGGPRCTQGNPCSSHNAWKTVNTNDVPSYEHKQPDVFATELFNHLYLHKVPIGN